MAKKSTKKTTKKVPPRSGSDAEEVRIQGVRVKRNQVGSVVQRRVNAGVSEVTAIKLGDGSEYLVS